MQKLGKDSDEMQGGPFYSSPGISMSRRGGYC